MPSSEEEVARCLAAARSGSPDALGQLLETCRGYLQLIAEQELNPALRSKGGASDLVQETFLEAQRDFANFRGTTEAELLGWLRQILLNNLASFTRRFRDTAKRRLQCEISLDRTSPTDELTDEPVSHCPSPSEEAIAHEQQEILLRALDRLPEDYRRVLLLRFQGGHSFEEIGRLLDRSANAARKLWLRAVERLQQELETPTGGCG